MFLQREEVQKYLNYSLVTQISFLIPLIKEFLRTWGQVAFPVWIVFTATAGHRASGCVLSSTKQGQDAQQVMADCNGTVAECHL